MEGPKQDVKELQRRGQYQEAAHQYARMYAGALREGDLYMAENLFEEMFSTMVRLVNRDAPNRSLPSKLESIEGGIRRMISQAFEGERILSGIDEHIKLNIDRCKLKLIPREFQKRARRQEPRLLEGPRSRGP